MSEAYSEINGLALSFGFKLTNLFIDMEGLATKLSRHTAEVNSRWTLHVTTGDHQVDMLVLLIILCYFSQIRLKTLLLTLFIVLVPVNYRMPAPTAPRM